MALIIPSGMLIKVVWTQGGIPVAVNVLGAIAVPGQDINQGMADAVSGIIKGAFTSSGFSARISSSVALATVGVRDIRTANKPEIIGAGAAVSGTLAGNLLPPQTALVVTLRTANAGKSFRGRVYTFGYTVSSATATGSCLQTDADLARAFVEAIKTSMKSSNVPLAVLSRVRAEANEVTLTQMRDNRFDTIRGRGVPGV